MTSEQPNFYFIFDTETGGLIKDNPSLLTVDGILTDHELTVIDTISLKVKPDDGVYRVNPRALQINGIDLVEHDKEAVIAKYAAGDLADFFKKHVGQPDFTWGPRKGQQKIVPCGHYIEFDMHFLKTTLPQAAAVWSLVGGIYCWAHYFQRRTLDTAGVAQFLKLQGKLPEDISCSLESLADYFGFDYVGAHNSAFDAELTRKVLKKMLEPG